MNLTHDVHLGYLLFIILYVRIDSLDTGLTALQHAQ